MQGVYGAWLLATWRKVRTGFHDQHDPCEGLGELLRRYRAWPARRVIEIHALTVKAFDYHKMVEVPEDNAGAAQFLQRRHFQTEPGGTQAIVLRRLEHVGSGAPVTGHATLAPE